MVWFLLINYMKSSDKRTDRKSNRKESAFSIPELDVILITSTQKCADRRKNDKNSSYESRTYSGCR